MYLFTNVFQLGGPITIICILPWRPVKKTQLTKCVKSSTLALEKSLYAKLLYELINHN